MTSTAGDEHLSTLRRASDIIEAVREADGARVSELASRVDMATSTVHSHLSTLESLGFLVKRGDEYHVGLRFLHLGGHACHRRDEFVLAKEKVRSLVDETQERVQYIVEEHGRGFYLYTMAGADAVQIDARIGKRNHLHASAAGKSILAHLPESRVREILDRHPPVALTENTVTDREALLDELHEVRERGYSFNREESVDGLRAVGTPVQDPNGRVLGALSISAPANRMTGDRFETELPNLLLGATNEIELNLAFS